MSRPAGRPRRRWYDRLDETDVALGLLAVTLVLVIVVTLVAGTT